MTALPFELRSAITRATFHALEGDATAVSALATEVDDGLAALDPLSAPRIASEIQNAIHWVRLLQPATFRPMRPSRNEEAPLLSRMERLIHRVRSLLLRRRLRRFSEHLQKVTVATRALPLLHPSLAWVLTCHRDGHVREAALRALEPPCPNAFHLALILVRVNDWVGEIRTLALSRLPAFWHAAPPDERVSLLPLVLDRGRMGRLGADRTTLEAIAAARDIRKEIVADLIANDGRHSARLFALVLREEWIDRHLPRLSGKAASPLVRARALSAIATGRVKWRTGWHWEAADSFHAPTRKVTDYSGRAVKRDADWPDVVRLGLSERTALSRRVSVQALIDNRAAFPDRMAVARTLLGDRSPGVVERAAYLIRQDEPDGRVVLETAIAGGHDRAGVIAKVLARGEAV